MWLTALLFSLALIQVAVILVWLWQHVEMNRIEREGLRVANRPRFDEPPPLTVIIPARNEAGRIAECLRSLLRQDYPGLQVIVVDDRSSDGTAECVNNALAGDHRCRVHRIEALPEGWGGKSHALWIGAGMADTPWLLFLDADCRVEPDGLSSALQYAIEQRADLLSLWPRDASEGFWERLLIPLCGAMIVIWYGRRDAHDPTASTAFANGQFLLCRREAYEAIGGHAAVKDALVEDIPLARLAKARGLSVLSAIGTDIFRVRMYASLREVVSGWRRIYMGVLSPTQILFCALSILIGSLPPFVVLPILLTCRPIHAGPWFFIFVSLCAAHLAALMATSIRFFSIAQCKLRYLWLYPLSCLGVMGILGTAFVQTFAQSEIQWRGTSYRVQRSRIRS